MGMEANVEPANVAGKGVWYRYGSDPTPGSTKSTASGSN